MQRGRKLRSRRKTFPQTPGLARKAMSNSGLNVGTTSVCLSAPESSGVFEFLYGPPKCWLKPSRLGAVSPAKKWIYLGSAKNYNLGSATMVRHINDPCNEESRTLSKRGRGSWQGGSKQSVHWRNWEIKYSRFLLAKLWLSLIGWVLAGQEEKVFLHPTGFHSP